MILKNFFIFISIFLYLTQVRTPFFTFPIFYIWSFLGSIIIIIKLINNNVNKDIFYIIVINLFMVLFYFISYVANQQGDFLFLREIILYNFFSIMFCVFLYQFSMKIAHKVDYIKTISYVLLLQLSISFLAFINPGFYSFIFSVFPQNSGQVDIDAFNEIRMVTLGTPFFGSAVLSSIFLIVIAQNISNEKGLKPIAFLIYISICILSILSARTAIIGVTLSFLLLLYKFKGNYKYFLSLAILFAITFMYIDNVQLSSRISDITDFGFEFLYNYNNSEASKSIDELKEMLLVLPNNFKTWIIGDAYFKSRNGFDYYKFIDIGFLRVIFNFGLIGLFLFIFLNIFLLVKINKEYLSNISKIIILICFLILMVKGLANIFPYLMLIFTIGIITNKNIKLLRGI